MKGKILTTLTALSVTALSLTGAEKKRPKGIDSLYSSKTELDCINNEIITFLNQEKYKKHHRFTIELDSDCPATEAEKLSNFPWLKSLELDGLTGCIDLNWIKTLKKLESISISADKIINWDVLSTLPVLKKIELGYQEDKINLSFLKGCKAITELNLRCCGGKVDDFSAIATLSKLKRLDLHGHKKNEKELTSVGKAVNLEDLCLNYFTGKSINFISKCKKLKRLDCGLAENLTNISAVARMPLLEDVDFGRTKVTDFRPLTKCKKLKIVRLEESIITNLSPLAACKSLISLNLTGSSIINLSPVAKMKNLESIYLEDTKVTNLKPLHKCKKLEYAYLSKTVPQTEIDALKKALPNCKVSAR